MDKEELVSSLSNHLHLLTTNIKAMHFIKTLICSILLLSMVNQATTQELKFQFASEDAFYQDTTYVHLIASENFRNIGSLQFSLNYDADVMRFLSYEGKLKENGESLSNTLDGQGIVFSWYDEEGLSVEDGTIILTFLFKIVGIIGSSTPLTIANEPLPIEASVVFGERIIAASIVQDSILSNPVIIKSPIALEEVNIDHNACYLGEEGFISFGLKNATNTDYSILINGPNNFTSTLSEIDFLETGEYNLVIYDKENTTFIDTSFVIEQPPYPIMIERLAIKNTCEEGKVNLILDSISGGNEPYLYAQNNNPFSLDNTFNNLTNDAPYSITVQDAFGCEMDTSIYILHEEKEVPFLSISDTKIKKGETVEIEIIYSGEILDVSWFENGALLESKVNPLLVAPPKSGSYNVTFNDEIDCLHELSTMIAVEGKSNLYFPSAFSPNGDGHNDVYQFFGNDIKNILTFKITNRWGVGVLERHNIKPTELLWDGSFNGKPMDIGIYRFAVLLEFFDGRREKFYGAIDLVR